MIGASNSNTRVTIAGGLPAATVSTSALRERAFAAVNPVARFLSTPFVFAVATNRPFE
jgi:hypothetical protein